MVKLFHARHTQQGSRCPTIVAMMSLFQMPDCTADVYSTTGS